MIEDWYRSEAGEELRDRELQSVCVRETVCAREFERATESKTKNEREREPCE